MTIENSREKKEKSFGEVWREKVLEKKSMLVAGFDYDMNQDSTGGDVTKDVLIGKAKEFIDNISEFAPAIKFNLWFYQTLVRLEALKKMVEYAKEKGLLTICDAKIPDIGNTNLNGVQGIKNLGFDSVTISPGFAGNMKATVESCKNSKVPAIFLGLMSNPEFIAKAKQFPEFYLANIDEGLSAGADGIVIGATWVDEIDTETGELGLLGKVLLKIQKSEERTGKKIIILSPGVGAQGGDLNLFLETLQKYGIDPKNCMINVGRGLMSPENGDTRATAENLQKQTENFL